MKTRQYFIRIPAGVLALMFAMARTPVAISQEGPPPETTTAEEPAEAVGAVPERIPVVETTVPAVLENGLISIQLDDVPLETAVKMFIGVAGANIIASSTNLTGRVTVNLRDVEWRTALQSILEIHNLTLVEKRPDSQVYVIVPRPADAPEPMFIENFILQYKRPEALVTGVKELLGANGKVLHSGGNMLTVMATAGAMPNVRQMIMDVDQPVPQVLIEAKFVELNDSAIKNLGINWQSLEGLTVSLTQPTMDFYREEIRRRMDQDARVATDSARTASSFDSSRLSTPTTDLATGVGTGTDAYTRRREEARGSSHADYRVSGRNFEDFDSETGEMTMVSPYDMEETRAYSAILTAPEFAVTLSALQQTGGVDVISNPKLVVASGERATIHVGRKDPEIKAVADTNLEGRLTYQREGWIESGVRLDVTPIVNTPNSISVTIMPQLSRVIEYQESGDVKVRLPILSTREISSQFILPSGRTVAIGGLTETTDRETVRKIPFLGDLPLIGKYLFSHRRTERVQDEIIIFVTLAIAETEMMNSSSGIPTEGQLIRAYMPRIERGPTSETESGDGGATVSVPLSDIHRPAPR